MSLELIGGALLGAVVSELLKAVIHAKAKASSFKPFLEKLTITLKSIIPKVEEIIRLDDEERKRTNSEKGLDLDRLIMLLREGNILVEKCSSVQSWEYFAKKKYCGKIQELDNDLIRFFQLDAQAAIWSDVKNIKGMVNDVNQQLKQLTADRASGSSSNNGAGARDGDGGVNDLIASVPIKSTMVLTSSVHQKVGSTKANEKLDPQFERAAPISLGNRQKYIIRYSESNINRAVAASEVVSFRDDESVAKYHIPFGVARTSLSEGLELKFLQDVIKDKCDYENIKPSPWRDEYKHPWLLFHEGHSYAILCKASQLVILTKSRNYGPLAIKKYNHDKIKRDHYRHMESVESFKHENLVPLRAYYLRFRPLAYQMRCLTVDIDLVYDYYKKGSVHKMLHGELKVPFGWDARLRAAIGVARGITFIHRQDNGTSFHGCIKSENIFLNTRNYGCISELGKCIAGYREPYVIGSGSWVTLQDFDVYNYGIFLLELVTGNIPCNGIVEKFKTCVGSREQLVSKVGYFIYLKQLNSEELYFQLLDPELLVHYKNLKEQVIEILQIAMDCVSEPAPKINDVLKVVEGLLDPELLVHYKKLKEQVIEILQIAMDCVSEPAPKIDDVLKVVEGIGRLQFPLEFQDPLQDE